MNEIIKIEAMKSKNNLNVKMLKNDQKIKNNIWSRIKLVAAEVGLNSTSHGIIKCFLNFFNLTIDFKI
jgi:hypothetical protein